MLNGFFILVPYGYAIRRNYGLPHLKKVLNDDINLAIGLAERQHFFMDSFVAFFLNGKRFLHQKTQCITGLLSLSLDIYFEQRKFFHYILLVSFPLAFIKLLVI